MCPQQVKHDKTPMSTTRERRINEHIKNCNKIKIITLQVRTMNDLIGKMHSQLHIWVYYIVACQHIKASQET